MARLNILLFNSLTKTVIGSNKFGLNQAFQEIIY